MKNTRTSAAIAASVMTLLAAAPLAAGAQRGDDRDRRSDAEWLEDCRDGRGRSWGDRDRERERQCEVRQSGMRAPGGMLTIDGGQNGGIRVEGWDRDSVAITLRIRADAETEADARELAKAVTVVTSGSEIRVDGPRSRRYENWSAELEIRLPRRSSLSLESHNGPIGVDRVSGRIEFFAQNGPVRLSGVGGDVRGRTQNGPLQIELEGTRWDGTGLDVSTSNGPIVLEVPSDYNAELETGTQNGPMRIDFPVTVQGRFGRRINTKLGTGGAPIRAVTNNGPVTLRRP